ncbi:MAG: hypothetical protein QOE72_2816, partial [Chloroflexota bacterium]|nr:hypothetical protein [Chloroflexota bacterium]
MRGSVWWRHPVDLLEDLAAGEPYAEAETLTAVVPVTDLRRAFRWPACARVPALPRLPAVAAPVPTAVETGRIAGGAG